MVIQEAKKYKKRILFQKISPNYYNKARREGWIEECCKHMMSTTEAIKDSYDYKWTKERIFKEVKKHKQFSKLIKANPSIYGAAKRLNILEEIKNKIPTITEKWTYEKLKAIALKYDTKVKLSKEYPSVICKIYKLGLKDELLSHMKTKREQIMIWTEERILKAILECGTRSDLKLKYPGAYQRMRKDKKKYNYLFTNLIYNIELDVLHPLIIKTLKKNKIKYIHHKKLIIGKKMVIPDFLFEIDSILYIIEAKTSGTFFNYCLKEIKNQIKEQIEFVSHFNKNKKIVHILLSEEGLIRVPESNLNLSLKEFDYFLRNKKYKYFISNKNHKELSSEIRSNYLKKYF